MSFVQPAQDKGLGGGRVQGEAVTANQQNNRGMEAEWELQK